MQGPILFNDAWNWPHGPGRALDDTVVAAFYTGYGRAPRLMVQLPSPLSEKAGDMRKLVKNLLRPPATSGGRGTPVLPPLIDVVKGVKEGFIKAAAGRDPATIRRVVFLCDSRPASHSELFRAAFDCWMITTGTVFPALSSESSALADVNGDLAFYYILDPELWGCSITWGGQSTDCHGT